MSRVSIIVTTQYGQTAKIAEVMRRQFELRGDSATAVNLGSDPSSLRLEDADTFVIGAPVYAGHFNGEFMDMIKKHRAEICRQRTAFFSVSLNVADKRPEARQADDELLRNAIQEMGFRPDFVASIGGALPYTRYGWFKRMMMRRISDAAGGPTDTSRDYEMTDWDQVNEFVTAVSTGLKTSDFATDVRLPEPVVAAA